MKLIVGLGNPGEKYAKTRHNLGFMILDEWVKKTNAGNWEMEDKFKSEVLKVSSDLWLVKPQTFMNSSGVAVVAVANYYKVLTEDIIIVHDDLDLMLGKIKIRLGGAAAGHHGVESVINALGSDQFIRIRLGIGNERSHGGEQNRVHFNAEHFVLESFMPSDHSAVKHMLKHAVGALETLLAEGLAAAQNRDH